MFSAFYSFIRGWKNKFSAIHFVEHWGFTLLRLYIAPGVCNILYYQLLVISYLIIFWGRKAFSLGMFCLPNNHSWKENFRITNHIEFFNSYLNLKNKNLSKITTIYSLWSFLMIWKVRLNDNTLKFGHDSFFSQSTNWR